MAALTCILDRNVTAHVLVSTVAIGLISAIAFLSTRHAAHARARSRRTLRQHNELACRYMVARWMVDPEDPVWVLFDSKDNSRGKTTH